MKQTTRSLLTRGIGSFFISVTVMEAAPAVVDEYAGTNIESKWTLTSVISKGGYSVVYQGHSLQDEKQAVAVKIAKLDTEEARHMEKEWAVYQILKGEGMLWVQR